MFRLFWRLVALCTVLLMSSCGGGGDSSVTKVICKNVNCNVLSPSVGSFVQSASNMQVKVEDGPRSSFTFGANTNILYATVKVCKPGADPSSTTDCQSIDKVVVDTGSVGLRVLASKVKSLGLSPVPLLSTQSNWECFPFVVGGLWGQNVQADVVLGPLQTTQAVAIQLIADDPTAALYNAPDFCKQWTDNNLYDSANSLGANGILGVGSTNLDCGGGCLAASDYIGYQVQYYSCPLDAANSKACSPTGVDFGLQVSNPVSSLHADFNNGFVLVMPAVTDPGAATATGEMIFGVDKNSGPDIHTNNTVPTTGATRVKLGTDNRGDFASYLNITTQFNGRVYLNSYLDTGTNYLRFTDDSIPLCLLDAISYCRKATSNLSATIYDGSSALVNPVPVLFQVGNSDDLIVTSNTAFSSLAAAVTTGVAPAPVVKDYTTFAWGMPFFYGKKVYMSIWDITGPIVAPWYAWTAAPL